MIARHIDSPTRLYTKQETAQMLNICVRTLDSHVYAGRLAVVRLGRRRLFRVQDVEAFIQSLTAVTPANRK